MLVTGAAADILEAACEVMTRTLTVDVIAKPASQTQLDHLIQTTMRRREPSCQEAVADVYAQISQLQECQKEVTKWVLEHGSKEHLTDNQTSRRSKVIPSSDPPGGSTVSRPHSL